MIRLVPILSLLAGAIPASGQKAAPILRETGVTVHFVDNQYDAGPIIWQQPTPVFDDDTPETLAARVFETIQEAAEVRRRR